MKFRDALWSSTVPNETLQDIQQLTSGVDGAVNHAARARGFSLPEMNKADLGSDDDAEALVAAELHGLIRAETTNV